MRDVGGVEIPEYIAKLAGEDGAKGGDNPKSTKEGSVPDASTPPNDEGKKENPRDS